MSRLNDTAVLVLTCNDYEALELTLDRLLRTTPKEVPIYLLSNCFGLHNAGVCEQMCSIASRAQYGRVRWINPQKCQPAYNGILEAINEHIKETYIVKLDDDVFPVAPGWLEALAETFEDNASEDLAYVTGLVNNNPFGFARMIEMPEFAETYKAALPGPHVAGVDVPGYQEFRINESGVADPGGWGTVWQFPQLARWIHKETTMQPERYVDLVAGLPVVEMNTSMRYSINVMYFHRDLWEACGNGGTDDEGMLHVWCAENDKKIIVRQDTPFVHLYFGPQKRWLKDLMPQIRATYRPLNAVAGEEFVEDWAGF